MWRKKKVIVLSVILATVVLAGSLGGIVLAQSVTTTPTVDQNKTILARVAAILGIDQQKLVSAFAQAEKEARADKVDTYLNNLVTQGKITQQQADQYKQWLQSQPSIPGLPGTPNCPMGRNMPHFRGGFGGMMPKFPGKTVNPPLQNQ